MADYIDREKVMAEINRIGGHNLCEWDTIGVKALIDRQTTEDVVPRSEYEELKTRVELNEIAYSGLRELYDIDTNALLKAKQEVEEERDRYKRYYFRHEYDKWEAEIKQEVASDILKAFTSFRALSSNFCKVYNEIEKKYTGETK